MRYTTTMSIFLLLFLLLAGLTGCYQPTSDDIQAARQEKVLMEGIAQVPGPQITNFRELKLIDQIYEMRDKGVLTYTYTYSEMTGQFTYLSESIGYPMPFATQRTAPTKMIYNGGNRYQVPQAEPNGTYSPGSAEATWVLLKEPGGTVVGPVYMEPKVAAFPFKLPYANYPNEADRPKPQTKPHS